MEEDIHVIHGLSKSVESKDRKFVHERLKVAIKEAQERIDYEAAHNTSILKALGIVHDFLVRTGRVCYGGTAMNAILPDSKKFYDPDTDLPDYDFFSPDMENDVKILVSDLKAAGFKDVYQRVGMHEGTMKIMVDFVPIADISRIDPKVYEIFLKRSVKKGGVHYTDPDILRMMMYLELSRPKGEVERWEKVFERLELINHTFPFRAPSTTCKRSQGAKVPILLRDIVYDFLIDNQRILCSGPIEDIYKKGAHKESVSLTLPIQKNEKGAFMFLSPTAKDDGRMLKESLGSDVTLFLHKAHGDLVAERVEVRYKGKPVALIIQDSACHSYNNVPLTDGRSLHIASPELLLTLYLSLGIFSKHTPALYGKSLLCHIRNLLHLSDDIHKGRHVAFPPFALTCRGYQKGYATLLREKVARIKAEKAQKPRSITRRKTKTKTK